MHKSEKKERKKKDTCATKIIPLKLYTDSSGMFYQNLNAIGEPSKDVISFG